MQILCVTCRIKEAWKVLGDYLTGTETEVLAVSFLHSLTIHQAKLVFPFNGSTGGFEEYRSKINQLMKEESGWLSVVIKMPLNEATNKEDILSTSDSPAFISTSLSKTAECISSLFENFDISQVEISF
jgi:hypothetical protein